MTKCLVHPDCTTIVRVNHVDVCHECWNNANAEEQEWFKKATDLYSRGLITTQELEDALFTIGYHELDPTCPVYVAGI